MKNVKSNLKIIKENIRIAHKEQLYLLRDHGFKLYKSLGGKLTLNRILKERG